MFVRVGCGPFGRGVPFSMCAVVAACWRWCCASVLLRPLPPLCALLALVLLWPLLALGGALRAFPPRCAGRFSGCGRLLALVLRFLQLRGLRPRRALQVVLLWPPAGAGSRLSAACPSAAACPAACVLPWPPAGAGVAQPPAAFGAICEILGLECSSRCLILVYVASSSSSAPSARSSASSALRDVRRLVS